MTTENKEAPEATPAIDTGKEPAPASNSGASKEPEESNSEGLKPKEQESIIPPPQEKGSEDSDSADLDDLGYTDMGDPLLNQTTSMLKEAKVPESEAKAWFQEAIDTGDLSKVNVAALERALGPEKTKAAMALVDAYYTKNAAQNAELMKSVYSAAGSEENWNNLVQYALEREKSDEDFGNKMKSIRTMLESKDTVQIEAATQTLFNYYNKDPSTSTPANMMQGDSMGSTSTEPLSQLEYGQAVLKSINAGTYEQDIKGLNARLAAGKNK